MSGSKKLRQLTELEEAFVDALFNGAKGDPRLAVKQAGFPAGTRWQDVVKNLEDHLLQNSESFMAMLAPRAVLGLQEILDDPAKPGIKNTVAAITNILDRIGLTKKDRLEVSAGEGATIVLLPPKD